MIPLIRGFISDSILQILNSYESQKAMCLGNAIWNIFIFIMSISNYRCLLKYIRKILYFGLNGIQNTRFIQLSKNNSYLSIFSLLFSKKEHKNTKKPSKIIKQKIFTNKILTISSIIFVLLLFINIAYFEKLYKRKQQLSLLKEVAKFLKNPKNYPIVPLLSFRLNDNEIICNVGLGRENESIGQGRSYVNVSIDISNCFFKRSSSYSGDGGVIYVSGGSCSMNINYSMFYNCVCSDNNGGAIYFTSSNSSLRMICANSCSCGAASYGHFARLQASQVNQVEYLSVSNCSHTTSGYWSIYLESGYQRVDNTNSSMNNAERRSGIGISSPSSFTSSHCTFSNNKVSHSICLLFWSSSGTISMSYANIVHNNSPSQYGVVTVDVAGSRKMMYCIFKNNQNTLFCVYGGSLEVSHSFIDHSGSFSIYTTVSTSNNNSFTNTITYQLQFFNALHCNADIPFSTPLSTIEQTPLDSPQPTLEMTEINTPILTPYRSFGEPDPHQSLFPEQTPHQSLFPEHTPHQSLFPEQTPPQSLFPIHTPYYTQNPERTNQRSFPEDFIEKTPSKSNDQSNNDLNENKSISVFMYSTVGMFLIIVVMISYNIGSQKNKNDRSSSSSSLEMEKKHKREEKYDGNDTNKNNDSKRDHQKNHHHDYVSSPYVF